MSNVQIFPSQYASKIWNELYTVLIPDIATLNPDYIKIRGVQILEDRKLNSLRMNEFTTVMLPIIDIMYYFKEGFSIQIPSREDMIKIHKNIELYLEEWKQYIKSSVHGNTDANIYKEIILGLEELSKYIYNKAKPIEVVDNILVKNKVNFGLSNPLQEKIEKEKIVENKPNYNTIKNLIKRNSKGDSGGRF